MEIQIRTEEMHRDSEYGIALHSRYKEQEKSTKHTNVKRLYNSLIGLHETSQPKKESVTEESGRSADTLPHWVKQLGDLESTTGEQEFWEYLREDFFKNRIFIFTPKGDVVDLPTDSTSLDFAYAIHSDIGDHLVGAKVNGKLVAINSPLHNGDIVEILTKKGAHATSKWLTMARTSVAKKHIRNTLQKLGIKNF